MDKILWYLAGAGIVLVTLHISTTAHLLPTPHPDYLEVIFTYSGVWSCIPRVRYLVHLF